MIRRSGKVDCQSLGIAQPEPWVKHNRMRATAHGLRSAMDEYIAIIYQIKKAHCQLLIYESMTFQHSAGGSAIGGVQRGVLYVLYNASA